MTIYLFHHPLEGVVMRRHASGVGCGACGRGRTYPRSREAPGPDRGYYGPSARSSLGWDCANDCRCAEAPPAHKGATPRPAGSEQTPGNADPGNRNRRHGAPRGARTFCNEGAVRRKTGAPLGAPPPRCFEGHEEGPALTGRKTAYLGPIKNMGGGALANWLFEN
jgi:hypothetical protein